MKHRIVALALFVVILGTFIFSATASEVIEPRLNNTLTTSTNFVISSTGKATITETYNAYRQYFTSATVTSYIEKRTLGIFWTKVDIGEPNNTWVDTSTDFTNTIIHEVQLESTGTYRATVTYEISGTGGATDVIDYEQERTYS